MQHRCWLQKEVAGELKQAVWVELAGLEGKQCKAGEVDVMARNTGHDVHKRRGGEHLTFARSKEPMTSFSTSLTAICFIMFLILLVVP